MSTFSLSITFAIWNLRAESQNGKQLGNEQPDDQILDFNHALERSSFDECRHQSVGGFQIMIVKQWGPKKS